MLTLRPSFLAGLAMLAFAQAANAAPGRAKPRPPAVLKVTVVHVTRSEGAEDLSATTSTEWYTPQGTRTEGPDTITLQPNAGPYQYVLDKQTMEARRTRTPTAADSETQGKALMAKPFFKAMADSLAKAMRIRPRKSTFMGYPALVSTMGFDFPGGETPSESWSGGHSQSECWLADVLGHRILVRQLSDFSNGSMAIRDVVRIEVVQQAPKGLFDVPKDYKVVDISFDPAAIDVKPTDGPARTKP